MENYKELIVENRELVKMSVPIAHFPKGLRDLLNDGLNAGPNDMLSAECFNEGVTRIIKVMAEIIYVQRDCMPEEYFVKFTKMFREYQCILPKLYGGLATKEQMLLLLKKKIVIVASLTPLFDGEALFF